MEHGISPIVLDEMPKDEVLQFAYFLLDREKERYILFAQLHDKKLE
jgi:hypothetical protein